MRKKLTYSDHVKNKGKVFGNLTMTDVTFLPDSEGYNMVHYVCKCSCGESKTIRAINVLSGVTVSCGCHRRKVFIEKNKNKNNPITHGMSETAEYGIYMHAKKRCNNENDQAYSYYGGRGIKFLFESFEEFYEELGPRPTNKHQVDRKDNNGHYEKGNVRWVMPKENCNNRNNSKEKIKEFLTLIKS